MLRRKVAFYCVLAVCISSLVAGCRSGADARRTVLPRRSSEQKNSQPAAAATIAPPPPVPAAAASATNPQLTSRGANPTPPTVPSSAPPAPPVVDNAITPVSISDSAPTIATPTILAHNSQSSSASTADPMVQLRSLHRQAVERQVGMGCYSAQLRRREQVSGRDKPEETMIVRFRPEPWSVYFKWIGAQGHDREVVFVKGQHGSLIHTLLAEGDMPFSPKGKRLSLPPDNMFVRSSSRHAITEAGIGMMIEHFGQILASQEKGERKFGSLHYKGLNKRVEFEQPVEIVEHVVPTGAETQLPHGGKRWWAFDGVNHLPVLVITHDHRGQEVEYYCYTQIQYPQTFTDDDFNPAKLWKIKQ